MTLKGSSRLFSMMFFMTVVAVAWLLIQYTNLIATKAGSITSSAESINASHEIELQLLRLNRESLLSGFFPDGSHELNRSEAKLKIKEWLEVSNRFISNSEERLLINEAERTIHKYILTQQKSDKKEQDPVDAYLEAGHALEPALKMVNSLTEMNISQARKLAQQAERENKRANIQAGLIALLCLLVFPGSWLLVRHWGYIPIQRLSQGILEFRLKKKPVHLPDGGIKEICEIAKSFNDLTEELADQKRAQLRFLAGVAHDLKNPLGAIRMSAELIKHDKLTDDHHRSIIEIISRQVSQLERMIGDLLETSRIESGDLEIIKQRQDIVSLIRDSILLHRSISNLHRIDFKYEGPPIVCSCDSLRISQVLNNLLNNAIKYSPNGGRILVELSFPAQDAVSIHIADEGIGIAEEDLPGIFEPFRRTKLTKETIPGVGLGLSVVRKIMESHEGSIDVKSKKGKGTLFTITLPLLPRYNMKRSDLPDLASLGANRF